MESRREFEKVALAALPMSSVRPFSDLFAAKKLNSTVEGVRLGMTTASLNPLDVSPGKDPMDTVVSECIDVGAANIELYANFIEPRVLEGGGNNDHQ